MTGTVCLKNFEAHKNLATFGLSSHVDPSPRIGTMQPTKARRVINWFDNPKKKTRKQYHPLMLISSVVLNINHGKYHSYKHSFLGDILGKWYAHYQRRISRLKRHII